MKPFIFLSICIAMMIGSTVTPLFGAEVTVVRKEDNGKTIVINHETVIQIELEEKGATGYLWEFDALDKELFDLLGTDVRYTKAPGLVGAPVTKIWRMKAKKTGKNQLRMYYYRPWEGKMKAVDKFYVTINTM